MSIQGIMKKSDVDTTIVDIDAQIEDFFTNKKDKCFSVKKFLIGVSALIIVAVTFMIFSSFNDMRMADADNLTDIQTLSSPMAAVSGKKDIITVPSGIVKANPFVPYRKITDESQSGLINDVPKFDLISPPEVASSDSDAAKVMDTVVSGILYDKFSPSAILNIDGNDYLVKKGDTVNHYKVLSIDRYSVTVKLGNNTYKAGIGELISEGGVNYNEVSNLNRKFGGEPR